MLVRGFVPSMLSYLQEGQGLRKYLGRTTTHVFTVAGWAEIKLDF
jgi:hypothetical protein